MDEIETERCHDLEALEALLAPVLPPVKRLSETHLDIRLPSSLKAALKAEAKARGMTLSDYVRLKLSDESMPRRRPAQPLRVGKLEQTVLAELNRIGVNLNQTVRRLNRQADSRLNAADRQLLEQLLQTLQAVKRSLVSTVDEVEGEP